MKPTFAKNSSTGWKSLFPVLLLAALGGCTPPPQPSQFNPPDMLEQVLPSVVTVAVVGQSGPGYAFGYTGEESSPGETAYARPLNLASYSSSGSGFLIDRQGKSYIVTNAHVIDEADPDQIYAYSVDQTRYHMRLLGGDTYRDVAVLEFRDPPGEEMAPIQIHPADDLRVGTQVFAIGSPLGFSYSISGGIISGKNRTLDGFTAKVGYLQTDATVVWGNSGGPLVSPRGKVIGLNSRIHIISQMDHLPVPQINFSLEGKHLIRLVDDIVRTGRVQRAYVGAVFQQKKAKSQAELEPVVLGDAIPDSPASTALAGLAGAQLLALDDQEVSTLGELIGLFEELRPGQNVRLTLNHQGERREVELTTDTLGIAHLSAIGQHAARNLFQTEMRSVETQGARSLQVTAGSEELPEGMRVFLEADETQERSPQRGDRVQFAGYFIPARKKNQEFFWRCGSLKDLGVIARIVLPNGKLSLVTHADQTWWVVDIRHQPMTVL